ncbi:MAG: hypothetical protein HOV92_12535 [Streptomyces sp.]|nr:hypothetical protein [Streptomyces sp.]
MAKLIKATFVKDPDRNRTVLLLPGEEPEPRLAALITNPDAWEDGVLPDLDTDTADSGGKAETVGDSGEDTPKEAAPTAAKKTAARKTAATSRSRGRDAAGEGDSGE